MNPPNPVPPDTLVPTNPVPTTVPTPGPPEPSVPSPSQRPGTTDDPITQHVSTFLCCGSATPDSWTPGSDRKDEVGLE